MTAQAAVARRIGVDITYEEAREQAGGAVLVMAFPELGMTCEVNDPDAFEAVLQNYAALGGREAIGSYLVLACVPEVAEVMRVERIKEVLRNSRLLVARTSPRCGRGSPKW